MKTLNTKQENSLDDLLLKAIYLGRPRDYRLLDKTLSALENQGYDIKAYKEMREEIDYENQLFYVGSLRRLI